MNASPSSLPIRIKLRLADLLGGFLLRRAQTAFETVMTPFVKATAAESELLYPAEAKQKEAEAYAKAQEAWAAEQKQRDTNCNKYSVELKEMEQRDIKSATKPEREEFGRRKAELKRLLESEDPRKYPAVKPPIPAWVGKLKDAVGPSMKDHITADGDKWDVYNLVKIMQAYMDDVFRRKLARSEGTTQGSTSHYVVKSIFNRLVQLVETRNAHAHNIGLSEMQLVCYIQLLQQATAAFGQTSTDLDNLSICAKELLKAASPAAADVSVASSSGSSSSSSSASSSSSSCVHSAFAMLHNFALCRPAHVAPTCADALAAGAERKEPQPTARNAGWCSFDVNVEDFDGLRLSLAFSSFCAAMEPFQSAGAAELVTSAGLELRSEVIAALSKTAGSKFKTLVGRICDGRNALFHNVQCSRDLVQNVIAAMAECLQLVAKHAAASDQPNDRSCCPALEAWRERLSLLASLGMSHSANPNPSQPCATLFCSLVTESVRMRIHASHDRVFVGRQKEIEGAVTALKAEGARVLFHGAAGMGKDATAVKVLRAFQEHDTADVDNPIVFAAWLLGSTEELFRRSLLNEFRSQLPIAMERERVGLDMKEDEAVDFVIEWLAEHSNWIIYVEDATRSASTSSSLCTLDLLLQRSQGKGRMLITSRENVLAPKGVVQVSQTPSANQIFIRQLEELSAGDCIEMWREMLCGSSENATNRRHSAAYAKRLEKLKKLLEQTQELTDFFTNDLGCLPLSAQLCGNILRSQQEPDLKVLRQEFAAKPMQQLFHQHRNLHTDKHMFGLFTTLMLSVDRMLADAELCDVMESSDASESKAPSAPQAVASASARSTALLSYLFGLSLLHESLTPRFFFLLPAEPVVKEVDTMRVEAQALLNQDARSVHAGAQSSSSSSSSASPPSESASASSRSLTSPSAASSASSSSSLVSFASSSSSFSSSSAYASPPPLTPSSPSSVTTVCTDDLPFAPVVTSMVPPPEVTFKDPLLQALTFSAADVDSDMCGSLFEWARSVLSKYAFLQPVSASNPGAERFSVGRMHLQVQRCLREMLWDDGILARFLAASHTHSAVSTGSAPARGARVEEKRGEEQKGANMISGFDREAEHFRSKLLTILRAAFRCHFAPLRSEPSISGNAVLATVYTREQRELMPTLERWLGLHKLSPPPHRVASASSASASILPPADPDGFHFAPLVTISEVALLGKGAKVALESEFDASKAREFAKKSFEWAGAGASFETTASFFLQQLRASFPTIGSDRRRTSPDMRPSAALRYEFFLSALRTAGLALNHQGRHIEALPIQRKELEFRRLLSPNSVQLANALDNLGVTCNELRRHDEAWSLQEEAVALLQRLLSDKDPEYTNRVLNLAVTLSEMGQHDRAQELERRVNAALANPGTNNVNGNFCVTRESEKEKEKNGKREIVRRSDREERSRARLGISAFPQNVLIEFHANTLDLGSSLGAPRGASGFAPSKISSRKSNDIDVPMSFARPTSSVAVELEKNVSEKSAISTPVFLDHGAAGAYVAITMSVQGQPKVRENNVCAFSRTLLPDSKASVARMRLHALQVAGFFGVRLRCLQ